MEFTWPVMLWALALVPLLWWGHRLLGRRQQRAAEQFAEPRLFSQLVVRPPSWQRSVPAGCYLVAVLLLAVAMARPVAALPLPVNRAAVIVAIDTSKSMVATDVPPTRLEAARLAARAFAGLVPRSTKLGLVAFSEYGTLLVPPGTDRAAFQEALERLQPQSSTSMGGGILEALRVLPGRAQVLGERLDRLARRDPAGPAPTLPAPPGPVAPRAMPGDMVPATIIVFSDGVSNFGPDPIEAAALAREGRVRIFTVGLGTQGGTVMRIEGQLVLVPYDAAGLQRIAQITDGRFYSSASPDDLRALSRQLGRVVGWERSRLEVSALLVAAAGVFLLAGGGLSLLWFRRLP